MLDVINININKIVLIFATYIKINNNKYIKETFNKKNNSILFTIF